MSKVQRSELISVDFSSGFAAGWAVAVPACFRAALDIEWTPRMAKQIGPDGEPLRHSPPTDKHGKVLLNKNTGKPRVGKLIYVPNYVETQGEPPQYGFHAGDLLYDRKEAYGLPWCEALKVIEIAVQVVAADGRDKVRVRVCRPSDARDCLVECQALDMTQGRFVDFLKTGQHPEIDVVGGDRR